MEHKHIVTGTVTSRRGDSTEGLLVHAYDLGVRQQRLLGEATVAADETYRLCWSADENHKTKITLGLEVLTPTDHTVLFRSGPDDAVFGAGRREVIDVVITMRIEPEAVEYDVLLKTVKAAAGDLELRELEETDQHRDITMLAKSTRQSRDAIEHLVLAQRLEEFSNIEAAFFYALLRQHTLLKNDLRQPLTLRFVIDINTDTKSVLYEAALVDPQQIERDIVQAVERKLVSVSTSSNVTKHIKALAAYKSSAEKFAEQERTDRIMDVVTQFVLTDKLGEAMQLLKENPSDLRGAIEMIANKKFLGDVSKARKLQTDVAIGELLGFDRHIIDAVAKRHNITEPDDIGRLARLQKSEWTELLKKAGDDIKVRGKPLATEHIEAHASALVHNMERAFPSQAFFGHLEKEKQPFLEHHADVIAITREHQDFDLKSSNIDQFFKKKKLTDNSHRIAREELKKVQRVFRLAPQYGKTMSLLKQGMTSSRDITTLGKHRFLKEIAPAAGLEAEEAELVYAKAETLSTATLMVAGDLQDLAAANAIPAINTKKLAAKVQQATTDYPNLKSLFKGIDTCECEHCRSVYGPAAYLVELLEFVDSRSVTDLTVTPHVTTNHARDVLFNRRPDLGDIDLNCANAITPLPYIDLVCEQLEELIAPDPGIDFSGDLATGSDPLVGTISQDLLNALTAENIPVTGSAQVYPTETVSGSSATLPHYIRDTKAVLKAVNVGGNNYTIFRLRQTLSPAEELAAAPEYVNQAAYAELVAKAFAFTLPFDLHHTEATAYFSRFDIDRADLMRTFQIGGTPIKDVIAAETLALSDSERQLITQPDVGGQSDYWNTALSDLKVVGTLLDKTGLSYEELDRLLALSFIDLNDDLFIKHLDLSCNLDQKEISNLDNASLDRIHRFLRLQKSTGWALETLDAFISQPALGAGQLNNTTLHILADLQRLSRLTNINIDELAGCYGDIPSELYTRTFQNKARNGTIDEALTPANVDGSGFLANVSGSLATCLQIRSDEFDRLLTLLVDNKLSIANLSSLFLFTRLMRKLKLSAVDIDILIDLSAIDPTGAPAETLAFAEYALQAKELPLGLETIRFMLYHQADEVETLEIKDDSVQSLLTTLQTAYQDAFEASRSPFDPNLEASEQQESLLKLLGQFNQVTAEDAKIILGFLQREWTSAAAAKAIVDGLFAAQFNTTSIKSAIDALDALAPNADISQASKDLMQALMDALSSHQFLAAKTAILFDQISAAFNADPDLTAVVLSRALLKQPAPGTDAVLDILLSDDLIDTTNQPPTPPTISEGNVSLHYAAVRLLHKLLPLAASFDVDANTLDWLMRHSETLGWLELDRIPYVSGHVEQAFTAYLDSVSALRLAQQLTPVADPADASNAVDFWSVLEMTLPGSTATREAFLERLALLSAYDLTLLDDLDAHFFPTFDFAKYHKPTTWARLLKSAELARKLASSVAEITVFITPKLNADDTRKLRQALKSRYDENTWLNTLQEVMDAIRPQKRDALVAYLLATRPEFNHANDLYDHLLIDVEMEACMPSSRIVQAHGAIQLFVQRCLMGLEPKAAADRDNDSGWEHWKWLKLFRVREVNHKIFLYPENWIEAELRDDKSFIFVDLENELQQNELTEFTAEQAFIGYMERLDELAFLEVVATWYQVATRTMHVFARTKSGDPATYYHRRFEQERYWTPWELVDLDITSDQLLALERNNRLTLAWPIFSEEPDPSPESTVPDSTPGTVVASDKPKRKLKIQLAVSEFADGRWQPKRVSKDAVLTPSTYTTEDLEQHLYNLVYIEAIDQILLLKTLGQDATELRGSFLLTGCKGYPELTSQGKVHFPDFFPDFRDTLLTVQRYNERNWDVTDELAARTALRPFSFYNILNKTPGNFRITYPHQMTIIDWVLLLIHYILLMSYSSNSSSVARYDRVFKIPFGTLLPYFMEDSEHAYVIIPGFYSSSKAPEESFTIENTASSVARRTASDVIQLIEDVLNLYKKYIAKIQSGQSPADVLQELLADDDYHDILAELKVYAGLQYGERFSNMYHPLMCAFRKILYKEGIPALMRRGTQLQQTGFDFDTHYDPTPFVPLAYPVENVDFDSDGSYSGYNWEIFFHLPMLIATQLTRNQRFEEAMDWLHFIFNPTGALPGDAPNKYWVTKPFFLRSDSDYIDQRIDNLLYKIADPNTPEIKELEFAIQQWRDKPFRPHVVARFRTVAYQKAILMKYIDNLVEWGDYLFRQDTMESITQATQMYVLADKLLGPKPRVVPPLVEPPPETYHQLRAKLGPLGNALIDLENILPDLSVLPEGGAELPPAPVTLHTLYFCVPQNEQMLAYWDRIADRLFKIRHCQNIDGIERTLALFAPPIDPAMLVKAAAAGLDISSIIAGLNAPLPYYRFSVLSQKASELANEVRSLGNSLLQALEKKDAEELALLRNELEIKLLDTTTRVKQLSIDEAVEQIGVLKRTRQVTEERHKFYVDVEKINTKEQLNLDKLGDSQDMQLGSQISRTLAGVVAMVPDLLGGASGFGGSPHVTLQWGGKNLAAAANSAADVMDILAGVAAYEANRASILGGYDRRFDDWKLQERLAQRELDAIDKQITAAEIRKAMAEADLKTHEQQIENTTQADEYMRSKFTNQELYQWMIGKLSSVYFSAYKLAHDFAKKAERNYQFELGRNDTFIAFGYWDSLKKGLQSADRLIHDINRMSTAYLDYNKREYEITKHISLAALDPLVLFKLRATGSCDFEVPEAIFDLDHPGHYFRRIKAVSMSLPCVAGPHTSVGARLSLVSNKYRRDLQPDNLAGTGYAEDPGNDGRFVYNIGAIQSIATSTAQQDSGLFELNFRDDRYLPFEGTGAISAWRLELPGKNLAQFNYDTIADVVLHLNYTAREGGSALRTLAESTMTDRLQEIKQELNQTGLHTAINLKHDLPNEWHLLKHNGSANIVLNESRLPYLAQALDASIAKVVLLAELDGNPASFSLDIDAATTNLARIDEWKICKGETTDITLNTPFVLAASPADLTSLKKLVMIVHYTFS
ncbi:hypothetical protein L861_16530 [Litchfieldella anticariensis FP35 = DSM 16096]|uniref:CRIC domain-containing protein n=1 Tax=Litchfieldella anticariensis (strain DSM 16096 / CECT 5854 / CIP 108499 / LMG 22089 / FP35) TaxID=1121939 RepID=S2L1T5_LITA3|nr:neuraminidase-like domain-containing protein [Halomonas anticariensis]EPC01624.1 hypothetical protein L861_16530 [Halomonas anticariensis FP35 = DSM 16096]